MKKKLIFLLTVCLSALMAMAGCSNESSSEQSGQPNDEKVTLKVWVDPDSGEYYKTVVDNFIKENPDKKYEIEVVESDTGKAQEFVKKDPDAAADVFSMPHDQLGQLVESGTVYKNTKYADEIKKSNIEPAVQAASYKGEVYGYPYGIESLFLYYDKSKLTEEDVKTFEGITKKAKLGLNLSEAGANYTVVPFILANNVKLYGDNGEDANGSTFNTPEGLQAMEWISNLKNNKNVVHVNADSISALESGKINSLIGGPWSYNQLKEILGDNLGVAVYPTADFGNGPVQLKAFLGVKLYSVKATTKYPLEAMKLANYLASNEIQEKTFKEKGYTPSSKEVQENADVKANEQATTVIQMAKPENSVVMPKIPEMVTFWPPADALIIDAYNGKIAKENMKAKLDQLVEDTSGK
ncbi:extracellular solute-binding protein [Domibacillus sp. PGB-M46]|uniref:extracellular solute-binding protein n=1 Tax=Domibacillus sp. PGB-M46 TaxID=2910255 RepID=UPI001F583E5E|nr:extracellular solute-binding protein [Domibacillus sp. PGB-M46]MCI2256671.1 extracellular solute-binding protein [Domibacillus sp. PGB-M46]